MKNIFKKIISWLNRKFNQPNKRISVFDLLKNNGWKPITINHNTKLYEYNNFIRLKFDHYKYLGIDLDNINYTKDKEMEEPKYTEWLTENIDYGNYDLVPVDIETIKKWKNQKPWTLLLNQLGFMATDTNTQKQSM